MRFTIYPIIEICACSKFFVDSNNLRKYTFMDIVESTTQFMSQ